jgi:hypothetical protein
MPGILGAETDPVTTLEQLTVPGLWIFSHTDGSISTDPLMARLQLLRRMGYQYDLALFSGLSHNNLDATFSVATD